jgi:hypothetical protein
MLKLRALQVKEREVYYHADIVLQVQDHGIHCQADTVLQVQNMKLTVVLI